MKKQLIILFFIFAAITVSIPILAQSKMGSQLLMRSASQGNLTLLRMLIFLGADVCSVDRRGNTALAYALKGDTAYTNVVEYLIDKGVLKKQLEHGSPYMLFEHPQSAVAYIAILANRGVDINCGRSGNYTPLMKYSNEGSVDVVQALIQHGAKINVKDANGRTALSEAVSQGNATVVKMLIMQGADSTITINGDSLETIIRRERNNTTSPDSIVECDKIIEMLKSAKRP